MSRIAKKPLDIPSGVEFNQAGEIITIRGKKGEFSHELHPAVLLEMRDKQVLVKPKNTAHPMVGTTRKLLGNLVRGASEGFERRLQLVGVGYRAKAQGNILELSLGFSHPVAYDLPQGVKAETPSPTDIILTGADLEQLGQVAAKIRSIRPPEPYKGKGVRYANEVVNIKETKKKK